MSICGWWEKIASFGLWDEGETNGQNAHSMGIYTIKEILKRFFFVTIFKATLLFPSFHTLLAFYMFIAFNMNI